MWEKQQFSEILGNFFLFSVIFLSISCEILRFGAIEKQNRSHTLILISSNHSFNESKASIKQHLEAGRILFSLELFIISKPHSTLSWGKPHYSTLHCEVLEIITVSFFLSKLLYVLWFHLNRFEQYISKLKYNLKNQENGYLVSALNGSVEIWEIYCN